jgi:Glycosyl transferase family 2
MLPVASPDGPAIRLLARPRRTVPTVWRAARHHPDVTRSSTVDVLVPTFCRAASLAVTLSGLAAQDYPDFRVIVSDQGPEERAAERSLEVQAVARILRAHGHPVSIDRHLPRRGVAEHRQHLLDRSDAPLVLFLDDDVYLEPDLLGRLVRALRLGGCGFVGSAVVGLSWLSQRRPDEESIEFWDGPVQPERVEPEAPAWQRYRLHNGANLEHVRREREPIVDRLYRVAWVGGCVLYDAERLRASGGFDFWPELPEQHAGEDVLAQQRVMARFGGAGLFPSGAYHLEVPTTIPDRQVDAPIALRHVLAS